jgi:hypothetical protein
MVDDRSPLRLPGQQATETSQVAALRDAGFAADFEMRGDELVLTDEGPVDPRTLHIDRQYRFEGDSDPDYESLVMALHDPSSDVRGVWVSAYGPAASPAEADVLALLAANPSCNG